MLDELSKLKANLDEYYTKIDDYRTYKKEKLKWDYYTAKLLIFQVDMTKARNFYYGVIS